jgi:putative transposase
MATNASLHPAAVVDGFSRKVQARRPSIAPSSYVCVEAVEQALGRHGRPAILNTDQGPQFTSLDFIKLPKDAGVAIGMDAKAPGATTSSSSASGGR